jgi:hypothetical protein
VNAGAGEPSLTPDPLSLVRERGSLGETEPCSDMLMGVGVAKPHGESQESVEAFGERDGADGGPAVGSGLEARPGWPPSQKQMA